MLGMEVLHISYVWGILASICAFVAAEAELSDERSCPIGAIVGGMKISNTN